MNKEIKGLERFVREHVFTMLSAPEKQKVDDVIKCLEDRYGRTRLEKIEELVLDWIKFNENDYDDEGDLLHAMEEIERRKDDLRITEKERHTVWMLKKSQKRRGMNNFQYQALRDVFKIEEDRTKEFVEKSKEVRVQT